eukprot:scaffold17103_cov154-Isochrysis_galbana.AAC.3
MECRVVRGRMIRLRASFLACARVPLLDRRVCQELCSVSMSWRALVVLWLWRAVVRTWCVRCARHTTWRRATTTASTRAPACRLVSNSHHPLK